MATYQGPPIHGPATAALHARIAELESSETHAAWREAKAQRDAALARAATAEREAAEARTQQKYAWERHAEKDRAYQQALDDRDCERTITALLASALVVRGHDLERQSHLDYCASCRELKASIDAARRATTGDAPVLLPAAAPTPVCATCSDTHMMPFDDREVMCTRCPVPCQLCRAGGNGPFCENTPCDCACHTRAPAGGE